MLATTLCPRLKLLIRKSYTFCTKLKESLIDTASEQIDVASCRALIYLLYMPQHEAVDKGVVLLFEELQNKFLKQKNIKAYVSTLQYYQKHLASHRFSVPISIPEDDIWVKAAFYRCILMNNYTSAFNTLDDKCIVVATKEFILTSFDAEKELSDQRFV